MEARFSDVLDPKGNLNTGLKLLGKVQWDVGSKSDFLRRIVRIAQKEMFLNDPLRKKVIQWPQKIYDEFGKRGQQIFRADSP